MLDTLKKDHDWKRYEEVLSRCVFWPTWRYRVEREPHGTIPMHNLVIEADEVDNVTGGRTTWRSRKWRLSPHMTDGEIVQTAFLATLTALEHETREQFKYRGVAVFDPHYDIEKLVALRSQPDAIKERSGA